MADIRSKALTYLRDGKVHVLHARTPADQRQPVEVVAVVEGHNAVRRVELNDAAWSCTCQSVWSDGTTCAHVAAVQLVTDPAASPAAKTARAEGSAAA